MPSSISSRWLLAAVALLIALAAWFGLKHAGGFGNANLKTMPGETAPLGLNIERSGNYLRVSWNRNHPFLRHAKLGVLSISEGSNEKKLRFGTGELASSTVLYEPVSSDVVFNLNVGDERNHSVSESVRAIALPQPPAAEPARPAAPAKPPRIPAPVAVEAGVQKVVPAASARSRATIRGTLRVDVKVEIDASGGVTAAELTAPARSAYFSGLALDAAKRWKFPAGEAGSRILRFEFTTDGSRAALL